MSTRKEGSPRVSPASRGSNTDVREVPPCVLEQDWFPRVSTRKQVPRCSRREDLESRHEAEGFPAHHTEGETVKTREPSADADGESINDGPARGAPDDATTRGGETTPRRAERRPRSDDPLPGAECRQRRSRRMASDAAGARTDERRSCAGVAPDGADTRRAVVGSRHPQLAIDFGVA